MNPDSRSGHALAGAAAAVALFMTGLCAAAAPPAASAGAASVRLSAWPDAAPSPDFSLRDTTGMPRTLRSFRGYVTLVTFGYANCPAACSLELHKLARAMHALGPRSARVRIVFVTLDPARDTPHALAHFVHSFDPAFVALRGTARQTDEVTRRFSIENARVPGNGTYFIDHPVEEFVFDGGGRLRLVGASESTAEDIEHDLSLLLEQRR